MFFITQKLGLLQMVRLVMVELTHLGLNSRFDVSVTYLRLIILSVVDDVSINIEAFFDRLHEYQYQAGSVFRKC
jgi:hypothetical protein